MERIETIPILPERPRDGHKGLFGKVLIIAGSTGMSGAAALAGKSALRSGAGLVRVACPREIMPIVASLEPAYTTIPLAQDAQGRIAAQALDVILRQVEENDVIALGPGFAAGTDAHAVIETNRGHNLGRIITSGAAEPNTGIPGSIQGYAEERVLKAPRDGVFEAQKQIGAAVKKDESLGLVGDTNINAGIDGVVRGLIRSGSRVIQGMKLGDIDPRGEKSYCCTISDKARAIAGSVLEEILRHYNA